MAEFVFSETRTKEDENIFLTKVLGITGIGVLATAAFGYLFSSIFESLFSDGSGYITEEGFLVLLVVLIASMITSSIVSFIGSIVAWKKGRPPYVSYALYAITEGIFFGTFVLLGVDSILIGGALAITALAFIICFALGYFAKGRMGWAKLLVATLGIGLLLNFLVFGIFYLLMPTLFFWYYPLVSLALLVMVILYIAIDANRVKNHIQDGCALTNAVAVSFAFSLYTDFMLLFWKILRILILIFGTGRRK